MMIGYVIKNKTKIAQEKKKKKAFFLFSFGIDFVSILCINHNGENSIAKMWPCSS
jgi:hypothetical protein